MVLGRLEKLKDLIKRSKLRAPAPPNVFVEGSERDRGAILVASTKTPPVEFGTIRHALLRQKLISEALFRQIDGNWAFQADQLYDARLKYPEDHKDFTDYYDAAMLIPFSGRAIEIKQEMLWQSGYSLVAKEEKVAKALELTMFEAGADTAIRDGTFWAFVFGDMYWLIGDGNRLIPLNPMKTGIELDSDGQLKNYIYAPRFGDRKTYAPEKVLQLSFGKKPWDHFGTSSLRKALPTIKQLIFMEEKLPLIARHRAEPVLLVEISPPEPGAMRYDKDTFERIRDEIKGRPTGQDIFHDGSVKITEVYQAASIGGRQTIEPLMQHFRDNLVAAISIPDVALGFGSTTTQATAEYQERLLEAEIRAHQRVIKQFLEKHVFPLYAPGEEVEVVWRPISDEDKAQQTDRLTREIAHGIISPAYARKILGDPPEAGEGALIDARFVPLNMLIPQTQKKEPTAAQKAAEEQLKFMREARELVKKWKESPSTGKS
jgi:hypothetical protein